LIRNNKLEARQFFLFHFKGTPSQDQQKTFRRRLITLKVIKGIVQPFELGGVNRLIRSAVKYWKAGNLEKNNLMIQSHERSLK
jgi:hypothetical protein